MELDDLFQKAHTPFNQNLMTYFLRLIDFKTIDILQVFNIRSNKTEGVESRKNKRNLM